MSQGWIKLHRKIESNWIASEPEALAVWVHFLLEANHETKKRMFNGALITIERGQFIFGLEAFSARNNVSISKLRRYLKLLERDGMINRQKTNRYSVITIPAYDSYQSDDRPITGQPQASDNPATGQPQHLKNVKNVNNNIYAEISDEFNKSFPELAQVKKVTQKRKSHINACISEFKNQHDLSDVQTWKNIFAYMANSDFLMGRKSDWSCDFDFVINKNNLLKILEGKYDNQ